MLKVGNYNAEGSYSRVLSAESAESWVLRVKCWECWELSAEIAESAETVLNWEWQ